MKTRKTGSIFLVLFLAAFFSSIASAQAGGKIKSKRGKDTQIQLGATTLFLQNQASQDGQELPGGTSIYSQFNLQMKLATLPVGLGIAYQYDKIGVSQTNNGVVLKGEFTLGDIYGELGFGTASQTFVDRAISSRTGTQMVYGVGMRFPTSFLGWLYFDGGVRVREINYTKQDGVELHAPLKESFFMPFIGGGFLI